MDYCVFCGSEIEFDDDVCPNCGAEVLNRRPASMVFSDTDVVEITEDGKSMTGTIVLPKNAGGDQRYRVLSSLGFMGSLILLSIPIMGQLIALVWALGGCLNRNRRNLARAVIYLQLIVVALIVGGYFLLGYLDPDMLKLILENLETLIF